MSYTIRPFQAEGHPAATEVYDAQNEPAACAHLSPRRHYQPKHPNTLIDGFVTAVQEGE